MESEPLIYRYEFLLGAETKYVYAISEKSARSRFKKYFGVEAGELIARRPF